jgi:type IX secretion system PorP/SprF family membrane protein
MVLLAILFMGSKAMSQADISMVTHWYNRAGYNPAFIARTDYLYLFSNARYQWIGVDGAPKVINIQASGYFNNLRSAFGLSFASEQTGVTKLVNPMLTYAYRVGNNSDWSLSMGLSAGIFSRSIDGSQFEAETISDPSVNYSTEKTVDPDVNAGVEFQNNTFIFGLSSTHLLSYNKSENEFLNANHRYGYAIYKNNKLDLLYYKLGLQVVNHSNITVLEENISIRFKHPTGLMKGPREILDLGMTYRSTRQITILAGLNISPNIRIGYAFDHSFITGYNKNNTHEVMLEYRIPFKPASTHLRCGNELFWYH